MRDITVVIGSPLIVRLVLIRLIVVQCSIRLRRLAAPVFFVVLCLLVAPTAEESLRCADASGQTPQERGPARRTTVLIAEDWNDRVIEVDKYSRRVIWEVRGYDAGCARRLPNGNTIICDEPRVVEVNPQKQLVWTSSGIGNPTYVNDAKRLSNGNTLICVVDYPYYPVVSRVVEIRPWGSVTWTYEGIYWPKEAQRLSNGNTLIVDGTQKVLEVMSNGAIAWTRYLPSWGASVQRLSDGSTLVGEWDRIELFNRGGSRIWTKKAGLVVVEAVQKLRNGNILAADFHNNRVIEIDYSSRRVVWSLTGLDGPTCAEQIE